MKKRILAVALSVMLLALLYGAAASGEAGGGTLVVYSANNEDMLNTMIPMFENIYGIKVELLTGSSPELLKRVEAEAANPYCDAIIGGGQDIFMRYMDYFDEYTSVNDADVLAGHGVYQGKLTPFYTETGSVILYNTNLIGDIPVKSYKDLLNPELKGKIATPDPANSNTGATIIAVYAQVFGDGVGFDDEKGWEVVREYAINQDGKLAANSGAAHKSVADGEMTVTITFEGAAFNYIVHGAPVAINYPEEGVVFNNVVGAVVKNAKNVENARKLIDFLTSREFQSVLGTELYNRPIRADADLADFIAPMDTINVYPIDNMEERAQKLPEIISRFADVFAEVQ